MAVKVALYYDAANLPDGVVSKYHKDAAGWELEEGTLSVYTEGGAFEGNKIIAVYAPGAWRYVVLC